MTDLPNLLNEHFNEAHALEKTALLDTLRMKIQQSGYRIVDEDAEKPWGAFFRFDNKQAKDFVADFFPDLSLREARLGVEGAELSPKILIVLPGQRLSWQYHHRRAERWLFLTHGAYRRSDDDTESERFDALPGEVVQFQKGERHRLEGMQDSIVAVAEIWQHSDVTNASDESDIVRVSDDYTR